MHLCLNFFNLLKPFIFPGREMQRGSPSLDLRWSCVCFLAVASGLRVCEQKNWQEALGPSARLFQDAQGPVSELPRSSHVVTASLSGDVAAPGEGPTPLAGAPGRGQRLPCSVVRAGGGWRVDPPLGAPSRPRNLCLPPVSPVIPVLLGFHHSPAGQVRASHAEEKLCCPSCGQPTLVPPGFLSWPHPGPCPQPAALGPHAPLRKAFPSVCLSVWWTHPPSRVPSGLTVWNLFWRGVWTGQDLPQVLSPTASSHPHSPLSRLQLSAPGGRFVTLCLF